MAVPYFCLCLWCYVPASALKILTYESTIISKAPVLGVIQLLHRKVQTKKYLCISAKELQGRVYCAWSVELKPIHLINYQISLWKET